MSTLHPMGNVKGLFVASVTFDAANITDTNTTSEQDITVTGVNVGDLVFVNKPSLTAGVMIGSARAKAANTVAVTYVNATGSAVNPASESYLILVVRPEPETPPSVVKL